ncbi:TraB/GumN family protein [Kordiimonas sp.]|uniref:TraB/GumN family protein n=1 Tax=Kordiimonas sp. TaxID=1970157 RepID=UPI003A935F0F
MRSILHSALRCQALAFIRVFVAVLVLHGAHAHTAAANPALWRMADSDTEVYIYGTLHVLSADTKWLTIETKAAFEGSKALIVELSGDEISRAGPLFTEAGSLPDGQSLRAFVGNGIYNDVERLCRKLNVPAGTFAQSKPWFAGMSLAVIGLVKAGFDPASGADKYFIAQAEADGKPVYGLEVAEQQVALFSSLNPLQEKALLVDTLKQNAELDVYYAQMQGAWLYGNTELLDQIINDSLSLAPGLEEHLLINRNRDWASKLAQVLDQPGRYFVAVGAGHLVGENSVIDLLQKSGAVISRIQ